jgi:hypothetical protein
MMPDVTMLEFFGAGFLAYLTFRLVGFVADRWAVWMMYLGMAMSDRKRRKKEQRNDER